MFLKNTDVFNIHINEPKGYVRDEIGEPESFTLGVLLNKGYVLSPL